MGFWGALPTYRRRGVFEGRIIPLLRELMEPHYAPLAT